MEFRIAAKPAELGIVRANDSGVGGRPLAKVDHPVRPDDRTVGVMISKARQPRDQDDHVTVRTDLNRPPKRSPPSAT